MLKLALLPATVVAAFALAPPAHAQDEPAPPGSPAVATFVQVAAIAVEQSASDNPAPPQEIADDAVTPPDAVHTAVAPTSTKKPANRGSWVLVPKVVQRRVPLRSHVQQVLPPPHHIVGIQPRAVAPKRVRRPAPMGRAEWYQASSAQYHQLGSRVTRDRRAGQSPQRRAIPTVPAQTVGGATNGRASNANNDACIYGFACVETPRLCDSDQPAKVIWNGRWIVVCNPVQTADDAAPEGQMPVTDQPPVTLPSQSSGEGEPQYQCEEPQYQDEPCDECADEQSDATAYAADDPCDQGAGQSPASSAAGVSPPSGSRAQPPEPVEIPAPDVEPPTPVPDSAPTPTVDPTAAADPGKPVGDGSGPTTERGGRALNAAPGVTAAQHRSSRGAPRATIPANRDGRLHVATTPPVRKARRAEPKSPDSSGVTYTHVEGHRKALAPTSARRSSKVTGDWLGRSLVALLALATALAILATVSQSEGPRATFARVRVRLGSNGLSPARITLGARRKGAPHSRGVGGIRYRD